MGDVDPIKYKMTFPEKIIGEPIIHHLSHDLNIEPNILRGRISEKDAWLEVEMKGSAADIERALQYLRERGVTLEELPD